ncbi:unnamed protein product [Urochloa decumbens]|uniref:Uncharacterized protein n=1 Tax=Urochloa decumbens TaxID=240449 RepID=A0ABC8ZT15_9POAL
MQVLRGGERDGVRVLGGGAGGVPAARRGGAGDGGGPAGAGAALLGGRGGRRVRHPRGARQLPRALGQGLQRLRRLLRARHGRRHRLTHRRLRKPCHAHAHHPRHPQELLLLLIVVRRKGSCHICVDIELADACSL